MGWRYFCAFWAFLSERVSFLFFLFCFVLFLVGPPKVVRCGLRIDFAESD